MTKGNITQMGECPSLKWCLKYCYYTNKEKFIQEYKTHFGVLTCGVCKQQPWLKFNLGEYIKCICGEINTI